MKAEKQRMVARYQRTADPGMPGKEKVPGEERAEADSDNTCRCKEVAEMTPRKLLELMISDLVFWKKGKGE